MKRKTIQIGDIFVTKMKHLQSFEMVDFIEDLGEGANHLTLNQQIKNIQKPEFHKTIVFQQDKELLVQDYMKDCPLIIKYIGQERFEELETGKIFLCGGLGSIPGYKLIDEDQLDYVSGTVYHSYQKMNEVSSYIKKNPIGIAAIYNKKTHTEEMLKPIAKLDKITYKIYSKEARDLAFEKIELKATEKFMLSIKKQIDYDYEIACFENRINSYVKTWKRNK